MHKTRRRRDDIILRTLTYIFMTIAVIALALVCLFIVLGYSIDKKTGSPRQGGLIQFRSFPEGATVNLDSQMQSFKTPGKATTDAAQHSVTMSKTNYRLWDKSFKLQRGELLWLNARLVPNSVSTTEVMQFDALSQVTISPDKKWIAAIEKPGEPSLKIIDIRDEKKPKVATLKIPVSAMNAVTPSDVFEVFEWDFGNRYLLVKHLSGATTEWLRLDRSDETKAENLTSKFKLNFSEVHFNGKSGENFYTLSDGNLKRLSFEKPLLGVAVAQNVKQFSVYGDSKLALITQKNNQQVVSVYKDDDTSPKTVASFAQAAPLAKVAITSFFGEDYVAVSHAGEAKLIKQPFDDKPLTVKKFKLAPEIAWLYFSPNGQFLIAQTGVTVKTYNLERDQLTQFNIPGSGQYTRPDHLEWLDDFHFWCDTGGALQMFEFDGSNAEVINSVTPGYDVSLSNNGKRLFSIGVNATTKKPVLQSSVMVVE